MKELELELIFALADKLALQHGHSNEFRVVECAMEPSASVEAVKQDRRVFLSFARWQPRTSKCCGLSTKVPFSR